MNKFLIRAREWVWLEGDPEKDRSTGLVVAGAVEIALGFLSFSLAMLLLIGVASAGLGGMNPSHLWMCMGFLFYLTGWFIVVGLGSVKARRWARALVLIGAWMTIFFGTLFLALTLHVLPEVLDLLTENGVSPMLALGELYFVIGALIALQVVFPMIAVGFYNLRGVKATCERRNPNPCWTDRVPLPLLAMGFICAMGCFSLVWCAPTNHVVFVFGRILSGGEGMVVIALISVAFGYVGWGAFTRKIHAWWGAYALVLITSTSMMLTFAEMELADLFTHMGYAPELVEKWERIEAVSPAALTLATCVWGVMVCVYLVWARDCFHPEKDHAEVKSYAGRKAEEDAALPEKPKGPRMRLDD